MSSVYSACFSFSSPNILSPKTSEKPMIALSGVRSSCDMLARNSDLCRLAASIWRLFSSISRNSLAFWIARTDCVAKVCDRFTTSAGNSPSFVGHHQAADMRSSRSNGTARQARNPSAPEWVDARSVYSRYSKYRGFQPASRLDAACPNRSPEPKRNARSASTSSSSIWSLALRRNSSDGLIVLVDRPAAGAGQLDGMGNDSCQHGFEIQSRANRLTDFSEGFEFPTERVKSWFAHPIL